MITGLLPRPQLAILGTGPSLRHAPFLEIDQWSWWAPAPMIGAVPRLDCLVEIHSESICRSLGLWEKYAECQVPLYMQRVYDAIPASRVFPIVDAIHLYTPGGRERPPFGSAVDHLLALALLHEPLPARVALYGVDMHQHTEYWEQRDSIGFWLGLLMGLGVRVELSPASMVLNPRFHYGYEEEARRTALSDLLERQLAFRTERSRLVQALDTGVTRLVHINALLEEIDHQLGRTV